VDLREHPLAERMFALLERVILEAVGAGAGSYAVDVDLFNEIADLVLDASGKSTA
jgi:hypothetical protein